MKTWILAGCVLAAALPLVTANSRKNNLSFHHTQAQSEQKREEIETFTGRVTKNAAGKVVLEEDTAKAFYILDDQAKASKFEGQRAKVTGQLNAATNTIHVTSIRKIS